MQIWRVRTAAEGHRRRHRHTVSSGFGICKFRSNVIQYSPQAGKGCTKNCRDSREAPGEVFNSSRSFSLSTQAGDVTMSRAGNAERARPTGRHGTRKFRFMSPSEMAIPIWVPLGKSSVPRTPEQLRQDSSRDSPSVDSSKEAEHAK